MYKSRIMIIEDDAIEAMDIKLNLESMGYEVTAVAGSGEKALPEISECKPDLVLIDIIIKGSMNGLEVAQRIKDEFDLPFIYLTSHSDEGTMHKAKLTEPFAYLMKPFDSKELNYSIEIALYKHKMEKRLARRVQHFKNVFDNAPIGIFHSTPDDKFIRVNKALADMWGYESPEELISQVNKSSVSEKLYTHPDRRSQFFDEALKDDDWHSHENSYYRKDGSIMIGELHFRSIKKMDGTIKYIEAFVKDVTEQKEAEEARMKTEMIAWDRLAEIDGIYDSSPIGLCTFDNDLRYIRINENLAKINGIPAIKHIGKTPREIVPTLADEFEDMAGEILRTGKPFLDREIEGTTPAKPGILRTWIVQTVPFKDLQGNIIGISLAVLEITDMKKAQEEIKETMKKLELSNEDLQSFAYVISHDLKEPLRMVSSFTQLLKKRYEGKFDEEADEFIGFIVEGSGRMERLLDDLLNYSRITSAADKYQEIDLNTILDECKFNLKMAMDENNVDITCDSLPTVIVNRTQMIHVFQNLIANAIKFRSKKSCKIHIRSRMDGEKWIISVTDNGIGIDSQYHKRIFNVFQRLHKRSEYEGTGMGLFITKKIVERHNGYIWVESEPGNGSTFCFSLPVND